MDDIRYAVRFTAQMLPGGALLNGHSYLVQVSYEDANQKENCLPRFPLEITIPLDGQPYGLVPTFGMPPHYAVKQHIYVTDRQVDPHGNTWFYSTPPDDTRLWQKITLPHVYVEGTVVDPDPAIIKSHNVPAPQVPADNVYPPGIGGIGSCAGTSNYGLFLDGCLPTSTMEGRW